MQTILGYSDLLLTDISPANPIFEKLEIIAKQIQRMGAITKQLMSIKHNETQDYAGISRIVAINKSDDMDKQRQT
jgi:hypothetical protein